MNKLGWITLLLSCCGSVQAAPPPGHPSTEQAARVLGIPSANGAPQVGEVLQAQDSNSYTYILLAPETGEPRWLAAPRMRLRVGERIAFSAGARLRNFYSKKHRRTFAEIEFVERVWPAP